MGEKAESPRGRTRTSLIVLGAFVFLAWPLMLGVALTAFALLFDAREPWLALVAVPTLLWLPGLPLARVLERSRGTERDGLRRFFDAWWLGVAQAVVIFTVWKSTNQQPVSAVLTAILLGGVGLAALAGWLPIPGFAPAQNLVASPPTPSQTLPLGMSVAFAIFALGAWFYQSRIDIARPLDHYWYSAEVESLPPTAGPLPPPLGWAESTLLDDEQNAARMVSSSNISAESNIILREPGTPLLVLIHGPVGGSGRVGTTAFSIDASPEEAVEEGPVRRYPPAGEGMAAVWIPSEIPDINLPFVADWAGPARVSLVNAQAGVWALDGYGEFHFAHYYQLLNMVEQFDWARDRWITDVQPPLFIWVLGAVLAVTGGDMPTANVLLLYTLLALALGGILFVRRYAPESTLVGWLLPGAAAVVVGKLVLEPGSASMPDALYAAAIVGALAVVDAPGRSSAALGLAAQLLRYPGSAVVFVGLVLAGARRASLRLVAVVALAIVGFGIGGWMSGALNGWLQTVAWESGPEHWHGNYAPSTLGARIPEFYWMWLVYGGGTPILALCGWSRGTRVAFGTAAIYSLLLCTIDHAPTHYFLPLVALSSLAVACTAAASSLRWLAWVLPGMALVGLANFWLWGEILG